MSPRLVLLLVRYLNIIFQQLVFVKHGLKFPVRMHAWLDARSHREIRSIVLVEGREPDRIFRKSFHFLKGCSGFFN